jgi:broad specificity phosphatase PhoE
LTGITDIGLIQKDIAQVSSAAATLVGTGKVLDPHRLAHVFVSPRVRAVETFQLLLPLSSDIVSKKVTVTFTENIAEWDYGIYEGLKDPAIRESRKTKGLDRDKKWNIWEDGCEGGEYVLS